MQLMDTALPAKRAAALVASPPVSQRLIFGTLAVVCAAACTLLAWHHPLLHAWALLPCALAAAASARWPGAWPLWLLPLLPLVDLMPWTGWLMVEEVDLLVLAAVAGAYAHWAMVGAGRSPTRPSLGRAAALLVLALYGAALTVSMQRGVADAGGLVWGWWQGYHEPLNALRLAKSFVLAMLLLPLWLRAHRQEPQRATRHLLIGMAGMAATVALAVLSERLAHTGLLNFSSDYRASGLFWEMHVGGAALDAALALTMPFALAAFVQARRAPAFIACALVLALGAYASLVTFSRVVYVAVPLSFATMAVLRSRQRRDKASTRARVLATVALAATFTAAAVALFHGSGYRGMLALLGVFALGLPLAARAAALPRRALLSALPVAVLLGALGWWTSTWMPKAAYVSYAVMALAGVACVAAIELAQRRGRQPRVELAGALLACTLALCAGLYTVAHTWGGPAAGSTAGLVAGLLAASICFVALARRAPWPASLRWQGSRLTTLAVLALVVGVLDGGSYMDKRWSTIKDDAATRLEHARISLGLLQGPLDEAFGRGLGRYAAAQFLGGDAQEQTGDYRWLDDEQGPRLVLTSGRHILGWGEMLRMSQRIAPAGGQARVLVRMRTNDSVVVHGDVCEKHLLYTDACLSGKATVKPQGGAWQNVEWTLNGRPSTTGSWYAPRFIVFSLALESPAARAEFSQVQLVAADGRTLLSNADFDDGLARWFFSSDRYHLPWHAKNLVVHLLFEQGLVGCILFVLIGIGAFWRLSVGALARHPLAPTVAAALLGVFVVGTADSLLDMPRIALLIYLLLGVALLLPGTRSRRASAPARSAG